MHCRDTCGWCIVTAGETQMDPHIDADLARRLVADQFPQWRDLDVRPVRDGGWDNRTFHLGDDMLVRLPRARQYIGQVEKEQVWLPRLAPQLPLPIPAPVGVGAPAEDYPYPWSIYRWIDGETVGHAGLSDPVRLASDLADFLSTLRRADARGGPPPGKHNHFRGGDLAVYDSQTRKAVRILGDLIDGEAALKAWEHALGTRWTGAPVWLHGDVTPGNLLMRDGRLCAVIDFGLACVGDPACDLAIAWTTFHGEAREAFRERLGLDAGTWARGRAWALWKALIVLAPLPGVNPQGREDCPRLIADLLAEHRAAFA